MSTADCSTSLDSYKDDGMMASISISISRDDDDDDDDDGQLLDRTIIISNKAVFIVYYFTVYTIYYL